MSNMSSSAIERHYLSVVSELAVDLVSMNRVEQILWHVAKNVVAELGFDDVVIYLFDPQTQVLNQVAAYGNKNPHEDDILEPIEVPLGEGVVGHVALTKQPLLIPDTRNYPAYIIDDEIRLSELAVPIIADSQLIGVIDSESPTVNFYNQDQLRILVAIASMVATQVSKIRSVTELQKAVDELEYSSKIQDCLFEIAELIFKTDSLPAFYQRLHTCIGKLTFAENFYIAILDKDKSELTVTYCVDEMYESEENEVIAYDRHKPSITGYVIASEQSLLLFEEDIERLIDEEAIYILGDLPKAWLGVPFGDGEIQGIVAVQSYTDGYAFDQKDQKLLTFVAKHIHNAIERMQSKSDLQFMALHDPLTHLPNRLLFIDRVEHAITATKRHVDRSIAILFLDLDRFKQVNDTYGHHIGDELLVGISHRISSCLREVDTLCRLGGDEFAILLENITDEADVETIANKIIFAVQQTVLLHDFRINISTSIGITFYKQGLISSEVLLVQADKAMYQAKLHGRNQIYYFQQQDQNDLQVSYKIEHDFLVALEKRQLFLEFQPIVDLQSGIIISGEGLIRWSHPERGLIPPNEFLLEIQRAGLLHQLDLYVLQRAIDFLGCWLDELPSGFRLSINISGAGFTAPALLDRLQLLYQESPHLLQALCIEITEQTTVDNVEQTQNMIKRLGLMGIEVALDDFGTGYSSLSYIHQLTFDTLKIDRSFVKNVEEGKYNQTILETIISLSRSLNIKTVGEGVETAEQYQLLAQLGCQRGQGYFMSKPVSAGNFIHLIKNKVNYLGCANVSKAV
ncbi:EAL domain-containing protein [Psychrobium sp. 1_MG-2023]|uniref:EAL domain-containing protein n=1 Tax=Psychrobium sp. 1_MG-2023 TaxID=3062624 RepID=UPI000C31BFFE|nr:EAL domain-containing protein [Psychrobium sp. 1_MG-2023]MDP2559663.1 EAL domain-containing protein [Psychrobium sp. 1_MG-2023]PKF59494.1 hypothetical protein CW748_01610 [Alteromonadales bacterium alter-6D02]